MLDLPLPSQQLAEPENSFELVNAVAAAAAAQQAQQASWHSGYSRARLKESSELLRGSC